MFVGYYSLHMLTDDFVHGLSRQVYLVVSKDFNVCLLRTNPIQAFYVLRVWRSFLHARHYVLLLRHYMRVVPY